MGEGRGKGRRNATTSPPARVSIMTDYRGINSLFNQQTTYPACRLSNKIWPPCPGAPNDSALLFARPLFTQPPSYAPPPRCYCTLRALCDAHFFWTAGTLVRLPSVRSSRCLISLLSRFLAFLYVSVSLLNFFWFNSLLSVVGDHTGRRI